MSRTSHKRGFIGTLCTILGLPLAAVVLVAAPAQATCAPKPPDYPGCTAAQVRPALVKVAIAEYKGKGDYKNIMWGEHHQGRMYHGMTRRLNMHLNRMYARFAKHYKAVNHIDPMFTTFGAYRKHAIAGCLPARVFLGTYPINYCANKASAGATNANSKAFRNALGDATHFVSRCNGEMLGAATAGGVIAAVTGVGELTGGTAIGVGVATGGVSGEIGCQVKNMYNWMFGTPSGRNAATFRGVN